MEITPHSRRTNARCNGPLPYRSPDRKSYRRTCFCCYCCCCCCSCRERIGLVERRSQHGGSGPDSRLMGGSAHRACQSQPSYPLNDWRGGRGRALSPSLAWRLPSAGVWCAASSRETHDDDDAPRRLFVLGARCSRSALDLWPTATPRCSRHDTQRWRHTHTRHIPCAVD